MSNKFEKRSGFEHVNIKTSQTPVKSKQAYYVSVYYSFSQESPLYMFESEEAAVKFIREQYNEEWQITMKEREEHNIPVEADELLRQIFHPGNKCVGVVTHIEENQPVFIRLENGANAIAHNSRVNTVAYPGDIVTLAINDINEEKQTAVGVITNVIKQNKEF